MQLFSNLSIRAALHICLDPTHPLIPWLPSINLATNTSLAYMPWKYFTTRNKKNCERSLFLEYIFGNSIRQLYSCALSCQVINLKFSFYWTVKVWLYQMGTLEELCWTAVFLSPFAAASLFSSTSCWTNPIDEWVWAALPPDIWYSNTKEENENFECANDIAFKMPFFYW